MTKQTKDTTKDPRDEKAEEQVDKGFEARTTLNVGQVEEEANKMFSDIAPTLKAIATQEDDQIVLTVSSPHGGSRHRLKTNTLTLADLRKELKRIRDEDLQA